MKRWTNDEASEKLQISKDVTTSLSACFFH